MSLNAASWLKVCFLLEAVLVKVSGTVWGSMISVLYLSKDLKQSYLGLPNCPVYTQTFPVQPEQLKGGSRVHLWVSGMSLFDCDTPHLQSSIQSSTAKPIPLERGSLKWFLLRENPPSVVLCEKIKDVRVLFSTVQWKVEKRAGKSRRMSFIRTFRIPLWMAEGCHRARVKGNFGLKPNRNVSA